MTSTNLPLISYRNNDDQGNNIVEKEFDMDTLKASINLNQCNL